ncbi:MAG: DHH family phosphoesterase [Clostridia bacterium]|nr:DHH family phosphoesterase [Clostridia bacterium]
MPNSNGNINEELLSRVKVYLVIIAILCIILCFYDLRWVIPSSIIVILVVIYSIIEKSKKKTELVNHIQELATDVNSATKNNLINSPIPLVLMETDGTIIWKCRKFVDEFAETDVNTYLIPIVKEIKLDLEKNEKAKEITKQFNINGKTYKIYCGVGKSKKKDKRRAKEYMLTLYFVDETKYNELFDKYNKESTCIGIINIDNYDEIVQRALPEEKITLLSKIEKEIISWASKTEGLVSKTESNSFIFVFNQEYVNLLEKEKFEVLEKVKDLGMDSRIQVTLSISISNDGKNNYEKYKNALSGMEIVLGRGGDQAIVRKNGKIKFYGGKTLEVEKRTKVKARTISHTLSDLIANSKNVIIMGHKNIDIDALGSAMGLYRLATSLGKEAYIATEPKGSSLGKFWNILSIDNDYSSVILDLESALKAISSDTLLIVVDTHKTNYVEFPDLLNYTEKVVVIDHHRKSPDFIEDTILTFHEVYASSTAELVTEILQYAQDDINLNLLEAESLYGGIMVDTKNFTFKTGVRTFEAAAYLRKFGVDIIKVKKWFQADIESYNEIAEIVKKAEFVTNSIAISICDKETEDTNLLCAKAADELLTISDITASFVMGMMNEKVFISGRSIGDINVQVILEKLGGGGHITLAGAQLEGITLEEAHDELVIKINEYLTEIE